MAFWRLNFEICPIQSSNASISAEDGIFHLVNILSRYLLVYLPTEAGATERSIFLFLEKFMAPFD